MRFKFRHVFTWHPSYISDVRFLITIFLSFCSSVSFGNFRKSQLLFGKLDVVIVINSNSTWCIYEIFGSTWIRDFSLSSWRDFSLSSWREFSLALLEGMLNVICMNAGILFFVTVWHHWPLWFLFHFLFYVILEAATASKRNLCIIFFEPQLFLDKCESYSIRMS